MSNSIIENKYKILFGIGILSICFIASLFLTQSVKAESIVWTKTYNQDLYARLNNTAYYTFLKKPSVQISYNTRIVNDDTGELYACGDNVPLGTRLSFEFVPHEYTDVFWFGTGSSFDSPFGSWVRNAERGNSGMCTDKNYYYTERGPGFVNQTRHYSNLSMNPPEKEIRGLDDVDCTTIDGINQVCTFDEETNVRPTFVFGETFGRFHNGWAHKIIARGICKLVPEPLYQINGSITGRFLHFYSSASQFKFRDRSWHQEYVRNPHPTSIFNVEVPQQQIQCPINIIEPSGTAPTAPTILVDIGGSSACTTGVPNTYSFTATDADSDPEESSLRYAIDWNDDGKVDQLLPPNDYVISGTTLSANKTWLTPGAKTFKAKAIDKQGLSSSWTAFTTEICTGDVVSEINTDTYGTYPDGEVDFSLGSGFTNNTCTATWDAQYVSSCTLLRNGVEYEPISTSGELEVTPGVYQIQCTQLRDGAVLSEKKNCVKNPDIREI